jgi:hypothetical protein
MHPTSRLEASFEFINADLVLTEFNFGDNPEMAINALTGHPPKCSLGAPTVHLRASQGIHMRNIHY